MPISWWPLISDYNRFARSPGEAAAGTSLGFFFQAEDGIRDRNVTGVQTCALPISPAGGAAPAGGLPDHLGERRAPGREPRDRSEERRVGKEFSPRRWQAASTEPLRSSLDWTLSSRCRSPGGR